MRVPKMYIYLYFCCQFAAIANFLTLLFPLALNKIILSVTIDHNIYKITFIIMNNEYYSIAIM